MALLKVTVLLTSGLLPIPPARSKLYMVKTTCLVVEFWALLRPGPLPNPHQQSEQREIRKDLCHHGGQIKVDQITPFFGPRRRKRTVPWR